ncbi:uncharacterized protein EV154DRAFT_487459 [Mucor mucedo]|uniref:uncharacterized protein n=1 Tax=Mucor mucedo TaxID=29922 RepID=UPI002220D9D8|nr:uncharacterized protein EV154DRAFT_487459 [Mucor mucedo]KAI7873109.1 hypothetical protein EV154DRAFT_487459 [Mucor mucedo]
MSSQSSFYLPTNPKSITYELRFMSFNDIMSDLCKHTLVFQEEPISNFMNWCTAQKLEFLNAKLKKKHKDHEIRISQRELYVLKSGYTGISKDEQSMLSGHRFGGFEHKHE